MSEHPTDAEVEDVMRRVVTGDVQAILPRIRHVAACEQCSALVDRLSEQG